MNFTAHISKPEGSKQPDPVIINISPKRLFGIPRVQSKETTQGFDLGLSGSGFGVPLEAGIQKSQTLKGEVTSTDFVRGQHTKRRAWFECVSCADCLPGLSH